MTAPAIPAGIVGTTAGPLVHDVDARWLMAYAAALGEADPRAYDTAAREGPRAHPLFPVAYEWPAVLALREQTIPGALATRGVHATHALTLHRPPRAGDRLSTTASVSAVARHRAGALVVLALETVDAAGHPVTSTRYGSLYRGVGVDGAARDAPRPAPAGERPVRWTAAVDVPMTAAHVYTEGARIWNPIHTDIAVARAAGLPGIILHGTATLALAVSRVVARELGGDARRARRIAARFTGMVALPSTFTVRGRGIEDGCRLFDAVGADGRPILGEGVIEP